jgi:hypothetical protein
MDFLVSIDAIFSFCVYISFLLLGWISNPKRMADGIEKKIGTFSIQFFA